MPGRQGRAGKVPALKEINGVYPGFLWWIWAATPGRQRLQGVKVPDSVIMINGRVKAWVFYSKKEGRVRVKPFGQMPYRGIASVFTLCVQRSSAYQPTHLPACPNWIAHGVATTPMAVDRHVQYFSSKGLSSFLRMAEKHSEVDKAWELKLSKKYNDLAGGGGQAIWKFEDGKRPAAWEAAYPDQNTPHAFTGLLQRFQHPMGDCNHEILCTVMPNMFLCEKRACKYNISAPGRPMIHKLDIHSGGNSVITDDLAGSPTTIKLEGLSRSILKHIAAVACGTTIEKCCLAFRLLSDSSPVLLGCSYLRTDSTKAFKINTSPNHSTRKLQESRARSFARLVSGAQLPEACSILSRADLEEPLNISDDGQTFTCAITGKETPLHKGHKVTLKQLMAWEAHQCDTHEDSDRVPLVVQRAVPGLNGSTFQFLKDRTHFLLSWAYVQEKPALKLLRNSLETFDATEERQKVKDRFALKRQLRELQRLGMPLPRGSRHVLHGDGQARGRPNTCPASTACIPVHTTMPLQPMHTGAWLRDDIAQAVPVPNQRKSSPKQFEPWDQQRESLKLSGVEHADPIPAFFRSAANDHAAHAGTPEALTWRMSSPLVSGIPRPASVHAAAAMTAVSPQTYTNSRNRHPQVGEGTQATASDTRVPCQQRQRHHQPAQGQLNATPMANLDAPAMHGAAEVCTAVSSEPAKTPLALQQDATSQPLLDDQVLGQLDEESKKLAAMSQGLLKRAADLLGQSEEFEQAVGQAATQALGSGQYHACQTGADTPPPHGLPIQHELTPDEQDLLNDLMSV